MAGEVDTVEVKDDAVEEVEAVDNEAVEEANREG